MLTESTEAFLQLRDISHQFGAKIALHGVSLGARQSEIVALLGPSGSGKSTLLNIIAGIIKPRAGSVFLNGRNLLGVPPESRRLGMVFQDYALWPHMTVAENVAFPLQSRHYPRREIVWRVNDTLARVGLADLENRLPHQLSGGQQQRVALARAVVADTELLLLDEPLSALDPATRISVRSELSEILRRLKLTTVIVTHDREEAFQLADTVCVLIDGLLEQQATAREVYELPANLSVARFMGTNILPALVGEAGHARVDATDCVLDVGRSIYPGHGHLAFVPEQTRIVEPDGSKNVIRGKAIRTQYRGGEYAVQVRLGNELSGLVIEARSNTAAATDLVFVHIPKQAIHFIPEIPIAAARIAIEGSPFVHDVKFLAEEIA